MFGIFKKNDISTRGPDSRELQVPYEDVLPSEVLAFLSRRSDLNSPELMINVLDVDTSAEMTSAMRSIGVGRHLGLVVLVDANDSNPYCYITGGVAAGMVVHFNHDPEPRIEFESLHSFEAFLLGLRSRGQELGEVEVASPSHPSQVALAVVLSELARATEDVNAESLICLYLPLLRGEHAKVLEILATHESFFVREAVAEAIRSALLPESGAVLRALAADSHPQVRSAAVRASEILQHVRRDA